MKKIIKQHKEYIVASIVFLLYFLAVIIFNIPCPIKHLTGLSCAGCGMTRAVLAALSLDFAAAFAYHPLWVIVVPFCALCVFFIHKRMKCALKVLMIVAAISLFGVWICRMILGDETVAFDFKNSAISKLIEQITEVFA